MKVRLVFTAYRRPFYWRDTLRSWRQVRGIDEIEVGCFIEPSPSVQAMVDAFSASFPEGHCHVNETQLNVLKNPHEALRWAFEDADFAILAEEDILVSDDVLEYFQWCAEYYSHDQQVLGVCANMEVEPTGDETAVYRRDWFRSLVWGTWRSRWPEIDSTWPETYDKGVHEKIGFQLAGWDWHLAERLAQATQRVFIHPDRTRAAHIGKWLGTHVPADYHDAQCAENKWWVPHYEPHEWREVDRLLPHMLTVDELRTQGHYGGYDIEW